MRPVLLSLAVALLLAAPAAAAERTVTVPSPGPGPARFDRVEVTKIGPSRAGTVLVLMPGFQGGAGDFLLVGRDLVRARGRPAGVGGRPPLAAAGGHEGVRRRTRRSRLGAAGVRLLPRVARRLDHPAALRGAARRRPRVRARLGRRGRARGRAPRRAQRTPPGQARHPRRPLAGRLADDDLRGVGLRRAPGPPRRRRAGADRRRDAGLVHRSEPAGHARASSRSCAPAARSPTCSGSACRGPPASSPRPAPSPRYREPTAPSVGQAFPLLPAQFKPPVPATNRGLLGFAFDKDTSPDALSLIRVNAGRLAASGDPRDWEDGEVTPIRRLADAFSGAPNATEWYFPSKLRIDVDAAQFLVPNAQTRELGLRPRHLRSVDDPVYALQTDLTNGRVLRGARRVRAQLGLARARAPCSWTRRRPTRTSTRSRRPRRAAASCRRWCRSCGDSCAPTPGRASGWGARRPS